MPGPTSSSNHLRDIPDPWEDDDHLRDIPDPWQEDDNLRQTVTLCVLLVLLALLFLLSLTVNVSLLLVFFRKPSLRTTSNRFVMNLLAVNVVSSVLLLPLVALDQIEVEVVEAHQCLLSQTVLQGVASLSLLSVCILAVDQYLAVLRPLRYHHHMTRALSSLLISAVWALSALASGATALLPTPSPLWNCCLLQPSSSTSPLVLSLALFLATFLMPALTLAIIYCSIYSEAHTSSERTRRNSLNPASENIFNITSTTVLPVTQEEGEGMLKVGLKQTLSGGQAGVQDIRGQYKEAGAQEIRVQTGELGAPLQRSSPSMRSALSRSFRHRVSNASQLYHREESHTARLYLASLSTVLLCWAPLYTASSIYTASSLSSLYTTASLSSLPNALPPLPAYLPFILLLLCLSYSLLSSFLFAYRHRKIRAEVRRLYSLKPPLTHLCSLPPLPPGRKAHRSFSLGPALEEGRARVARVMEGEALLRTLSTETSSQSSCSSTVSQSSSQGRRDPATDEST